MTDITAENTLGIRKELIKTHSRLWNALNAGGRTEGMDGWRDRDKRRAGTTDVGTKVKHQSNFFL